MPAQSAAATAGAADNNKNTSSSAAGAATKSSCVVGPAADDFEFTNSTPASANKRAMEASGKRNNAVPKQKNMEAEAAIKIQAGFRGYQVRKQLKNKNNGTQSDPDDVAVAENETGRTSDVTLAKDGIRIPDDDVQSQVAKQWKDGMPEVTEDSKLDGSEEASLRTTSNKHRAPPETRYPIRDVPPDARATPSPNP